PPRIGLSRTAPRGMETPAPSRRARRSAGRLTFTQCPAIIEPAVPARMHQSGGLRRMHTLSRALNQDLQQFIGVRFDGLTNLDKFHDVDTPFAAFIFGDKRLRPTKTPGELVLCQAGGFARPDHQLAESGLSCRMDRFVEFARTRGHRRGRLIRSSDYPKIGYILTVLPHFPSNWWTCRGKEANCRQGQFGGLLWKTSKIWRLRSRQSVRWELRQQDRSPFIRQMLSPGIFPRLR